MTSRLRADLLLVDRGFYESRARAQSAIAAGLVTVNGVVISKASSTIAKDAEIVAGAEHPWVSRGGVKLKAALDHFKIDVSGRYCLDIGASTGGFTDVLLKHGAKQVVAVDVGHGQFHESLANDPRVKVLEGMDARLLTRDNLTEAPSFIVFDVSFISLSLVLPRVLVLAEKGALCVALIKPQFEVGRAFLKKGLVKDNQARDQAVERIKAQVLLFGWSLLGFIRSPIEGGDGNIEFLIAAEKIS
jgi:23S rRNA (cytidine1920-2'-O)/16S rRNA (cytidine1409-2'-O)-methyltransferase